MSVTPGATTGITIGTAAFPTLSAQPFGYEETNTRAGLTARKWLVTGPLKPSEWLTLLSAYNTWRDTRINDEPTETSGVVGTTINLSGKGPGNQTWTNVACWFISAPQAEQNGRYLNASVELVDANQALAVILKQGEEEASGDDLPDLGTITVGTTVLTLLKPPDTYAQGPQLELTASGVHYVTGPLVAAKIQDIEGTTNSTGWNNIRSWYESQVVSVPAPNAWFPISPPTATAENAIVSGVKTIRYTVSIQLGRVI
jgi:hypothetical protein